VLTLQTPTPDTVTILPFRFVRVSCKWEFRGRVLKGEGEGNLEKFLLALPLNPYFPLSHEYNAQFNGIRLPSVEQVDLMLKLASDLVESGESPAFLSTGPETSARPCEEPKSIR
jgi:hypothetical protein